MRYQQEPTTMKQNQARNDQALVEHKRHDPAAFARVLAQLSPEARARIKARVAAAEAQMKGGQA